MTYSESADGVIITRQRAIQELQQHCITDADSITMMLQEVFGQAETVDAGKLMVWLGY